MPRLYLGTMTFAWKQASSFVDDATAATFLRRFIDVGGKRIDTARIYAGGETEPMLGRALAAINSDELLVGSKAHPSEAGGLGVDGLRAQLSASLSACGVSKFAEYYLHQPDTEHSLLESLREAHAMVTEGTIGAIGMSNYHADEVARAFALCEQHSLTKPTLYQGLYNPLNRAVEETLLPLLHSNGCSFVAYNPLAAGLLTGAHSAAASTVPAGRFKDNPNYLPRFYTGANFKALEIITSACTSAGWTPLDATYTWLLRHSALTAEDGVLIGASSTAQLDANLAACERAAKEPLPPPVVAAFDAAWGYTCDGAFPYWRSYSADMPGRDTRDQGASYAAHGPGAKK